MESNQKEDEINEDVEQPVKDNNDTGMGRSYECVFCKRGFTTAQALGGHMNIHRKDRAKNRPIPMNSNQRGETCTTPLFYQQISSYPPRFVAAHNQAQLNYQAYVPASTSNTASFNEIQSNNSGDHVPLRFPFGEDCRMSFNLKFASAHAEDEETTIQVGGAEDELDLELRLGHKP